MAENLGTIFSQFGLDYRPFDMGVAQLEQRLRQLDARNQEHVNRLSQAWNVVGQNIPRPFDFAAGRVSAKLGEMVTSNRSHLSMMDQAWQQVGSGLFLPLIYGAERARGEVQGLAQEVQRADLSARPELDSSAYRSGARDIQNANDQVEHSTQRTTERIGKHWEQLGKTMSLAITVPATLMARQMVMQLAEFDQSMARAAAVSQANRVEWERMTEVARELGATTRYTAREAADGMTFLAMAGFGVNQTIAAMPGVLQLAASAQLDLATAADITTNILTGYGLAVEELGRVNDVLVSAMTGANTNLQQLGEAMKYAGPVASAAGIAFEESAAAIALMSNAGIQASMAGTSLRGALTRLLNPTGENARLIKELGLNIFDTNGNLVSLVEIVEQLERSGITAGQMMQLFGQRAGPAMQALVDQGSRALREFNQRLLESEGIAARVATMQEDNLAGSARILKSAYEELSLSLVSSVEPALRTIFDTLADVLRVLADLPEPVQRGAVVFGVATAAAGPLILALRSIATAAAPLLGPAGIVLGVAAALGTLATAFGYVSDRARAASAGGLADNIEKTLEQARATREQISELDRLIARYDALSGKPDKSADEHEELRKVIDQIVALAPDAVTGYDEMGRALIGNAEAARQYRDELAKTLEMTLEVTAEEARIRLPFLEAELERKRQELQQANALAQEARDDWLSAVRNNEQFSINVYRQEYEYRQAQAAALSQEVRGLIEDLGRLSAAQAKLDAFRRGEVEESADLPSLVDLIDDEITAQETLLEEEIRIWQARIAATREGTAEQRRIIEAFYQWVNAQIAEIDVNPFVGVMGLSGQDLEHMSTLRPLQTQLGSLVEEMRALDEVARVTSRTLEDVHGEGVVERWRRQIELLNLQRVELERLQERAESMGVVGESAATVYREAVREVNSEINTLNRLLQDTQKEAIDSIQEQIKLQQQAGREAQRVQEAAIRRQMRELEIEQEIRRIRGEPLTTWEELQQLQDFLDGLRERAATRIEFEYVFDGMVLRATTRALSDEFVANLEQQIRDEMALLEARLTIRPTATLTLGPVATILEEYEKRLAAFDRASRFVDGFNYLQEAINLTNQTLMRLAEEGLDESDAAVRKLRENLERLQALASAPRFGAQTPQGPLQLVELDPIDARLDEMSEALRQVDVQAIAFGESFDAIAAKAQVVRSALNDVIRLGIDPADARFRRLVSMLSIYEMEVSPVTRALNELSQQLVINSRVADAQGEAFDRNKADAAAYQRALESLARESLSLTGEELENAVFWMRLFGEEIRARTEDTDRLRRAQERLGRALIDVVRTEGQSLGSFLGQLWETAEDEAVSFADAMGMAMQGVLLNTGSIVTSVVDGIMQSIRAVGDAYNRLDQRAKESADRNADLQRRFDQLAQVGFSGSFERDVTKIIEKVEGGLLTGIGQFLGLIPREVSRTIYEVSQSTEEWIERMEKLFLDAADVGRSAMRDAFDDPEMDFLLSLRTGVYDYVRDGLINAFSESQVYMRAMAPLFQALDQAMEEAFAGGTFDEAVFNRIAGPALAQWERDIAALERPFETIRDVLDRVRQSLDLRDDPTGSGGSSGGTRLTNLTGESRDFLGERLRPLQMLDLAPLWHDQHMTRLDTIISLLGGDGELVGQFRTFLEVQQAALHSETVVVEIIQSATFTGPIGNVVAQIGEDDAREIVRQIMDRYGFGGSALARAEGN